MAVSIGDEAVAAAAPGRAPRAAGEARARTARRRLASDRVARWLVTAGGLGIIASILGILVFIVIEVWPLTRAAAVEVGEVVAVAGPPAGALVCDEYRTLAAGLAADGVVRVVRTADGAVVEERRIWPAAAPSGAEPALAAEPRLVRIQPAPGGSVLLASTSDGRVLAVPVGWEITFDEDRRVVTADVGAPVVFEVDPEGRPVEVFAAALEADGAGAAAAVLADGTVALVERQARANLLTGEVTESFERRALAAPLAPAVLALDRTVRNLYGGAASGELLWWDLTAGEAAPRIDRTGSSPVTALSLLIGHHSLVVGRADGALSIWFQARQEDGSFRLADVRDFPPLPGPVELISPSMRNKGFVAGSGGHLGLYHSTSHRVLWAGTAPLPEPPTALVLTPKADGAFVAGAGGLAALAIDNPHPETTWTALFGKVWYEGYEEPQYVWQSTGGSDDFEPKLSLMPLLVGTLKGTIYSLLLAIPLGVLGAMYTSQFMHPIYQHYVKPTVEIMAALPTVVLGFLAGLWLAPRLEKVFPSLLLMVVMLPLLVLLAGAAWQRLPRAFRNRFPTGVEAILFIFVAAFGIWLATELSPPFERLVFGGSFPRWLLEATGLTYDQRNAVVVGLAMGFAVIPIIFAISEDAFSNVPANLVAGSLALGANRWQTVTRVVLPTASPGIFSAVMIGFGRAVGETMIVLMATGNTPIMDWSPFNGFRTLSANIAVEIPEAPVGGTLYRALFLAALLLFVLTFAVNTVAEVVRQRLRRRYSQL